MQMHFAVQLSAVMNALSKAPDNKVSFKLRIFYMNKKYTQMRLNQVQSTLVTAVLPNVFGTVFLQTLYDPVSLFNLPLLCAVSCLTTHWSNTLL